MRHTGGYAVRRHRRTRLAEKAHSRRFLISRLDVFLFADPRGSHSGFGGPARKVLEPIPIVTALVAGGILVLDLRAEQTDLAGGACGYRCRRRRTVADFDELFTGELEEGIGIGTHAQAFLVPAPEPGVRNLCATVRRLRVIYRRRDIRASLELSAIRSGDVAVPEDQWTHHTRRITVGVETDVGFGSPRGF